VQNHKAIFALRSSKSFKAAPGADAVFDEAIEAVRGECAQYRVSPPLTGIGFHLTGVFGVRIAYFTVYLDAHLLQLKRS
jgi:hypothetical protein